MHSCVDETTFRCLSEKEVICTSDGARLGFVFDLEIDLSSGCIKALLLPENKAFSFSRKPGYRVLLEWVERIGEDLILVCRYQRLSPAENGKGGKKGRNIC